MMTRSIAPTEWNRPPAAHMNMVLEGLKHAAQKKYPIRALTMQNSPEAKHPDQLLIDIENPRFMPLAESPDVGLGRAALRCLIHIGGAPRLYGVVSQGKGDAVSSVQLVGLAGEKRRSSVACQELLPYRVQRLPFLADLSSDTAGRMLSIIPVDNKADEFALSYWGRGYADIFAVERHGGQAIDLVEHELWTPQLVQHPSMQ